MAKVTSSTGAHTAYTVNSTDLQGNCYRLNRILQQINGRLGTLENPPGSSTGNSSSTAASVLVVDTTMTSNTTFTIPSTQVEFIVIIARQDATGGRAISFSAGFIAYSTGIDTAASTISTFLFARSGNEYVQIGQPSTGMTP